MYTQHPYSGAVKLGVGGKKLIDYSLQQIALVGSVEVTSIDIQRQLGATTGYHIPTHRCKVDTATATQAGSGRRVCSQ